MPQKLAAYQYPVGFISQGIMTDKVINVVKHQQPHLPKSKSGTGRSRICPLSAVTQFFGETQHNVSIFLAQLHEVKTVYVVFHCGLTYNFTYIFDLRETNVPFRTTLAGKRKKHFRPSPYFLVHVQRDG